ncbi:acetyl/propionyl/methylcrotonyl-CoA carboxylase subunit alpha [Alkalicaulis satelles]|uniref:propionyl-CoA carboxylase n=1 Tax=Alkalicaulis satelles TaxID=2609175 RepID=A0A5M6ZAJ5_9PROT|nr:acetyl/propionyl/methylcrotonyl-CoA carboxylase subunit alpha [Alkalicaulis satelles]KAA5801716.1 acetyl/propionyl/methylcrotonyl-CoA carboxylase subunit alpha [Alkalicaulis satelles]
MFKKILIANRGEIAVRIIKTCKRMGIATVAVYSEADADSLAVRMADEAVFIGPPAPGQSYLDMDKIIAACEQTGAEAVHPGFGFLSENAAFPRALAKRKIGWIGPNPDAIAAMGDKLESKKLAAKAGVNTVPGFKGEIVDDQQAVEVANDIGYPVMIKASAGGGGKGMRIARAEADVREGFKAARNEAKSSFGDDRILIEKFIERPRHIEIQVLGDRHGDVIHLNERECSVQRRNQKVLEEAPSPFLDAATRRKMGEQAVALARAVNYDSAGTVEFIVGPDKSFYFLEMNTRLQVEHPVTELTHDIDLVEQMIRVAAGEKLAFTQADMRIKGWAVEARLYAEDPYRGFLPSIGRLKRYVEPAEGEAGPGRLRIDSGVREGDEISLFYDPMIAKVIGYGKTREAAIDALNVSLDRLHVEGLQSNAPFLSAVLDEPDFRAGRIHTGYIEEHFPEGFSGTAPREDQLRWMTAAAAYVHTVFTERAAGISGRLTPPPAPGRTHEWAVLLDGQRFDVEIILGSGALEPGETAAEIWIPALSAQRLTLTTSWLPGQSVFEASLDGAPFAVFLAEKGEGYALRHRGFSATALVCAVRVADIYARLPEKEQADTAGQVISPMPGLVVSVAVEPGQEVKAGEPLVVVEAMKMENVLRAERDGVVKTVHCAAGASVAADELLVEFE